MTRPPPGEPGPGPDPEDNRPDPARGLIRARNIVIALIVLVALIAAAATSCSSSGSGDARSFVRSHYERAPSLDEPDVQAYLANGDPAAVIGEITNAERPNDQREGAGANGAGTRFLQYPKYLIALFVQKPGQTRVMVSRDYRSGYHHYSTFIAPFWVPTPNFSGSGSGNRGGGSGGGGK